DEGADDLRARAQGPAQPAAEAGRQRAYIVKKRGAVASGRRFRAAAKAGKAREGQALSRLRVLTKRTHLRGDAGRGGKPLPVPSAAAGCTPPGAAASRFRYHVPAGRFAHRNMMFPSLQG